MFDFATSVNSYILQNSKKYYWTDLSSNIVLVIFSIPLNYLLIRKMGILGAATAYLILSFMVNSFKAIYLYHKEKIHPFSQKWKLLLAVFVTALLVSYLLNIILQIPTIDNLINSIPARIGRIVIRSIILCVIFIPIVYKLNISEDINSLIKSLLNKIVIKQKR
jgi:O-antigen/teichoic acid export membrane protein